MKTFLKKTASLALILCLALSAMGTATFAAGREYAAKAYINDVPVGFINAPYMQDDTIFVPLKEACEYMNIALVEENGTYTLTHGGDSVTMQEGNMFVQKNGQSVMLSAQSWNKGGVIFVPTELFSKGLEMDLTADTDARRVYFRPNIYKVYITAQNAALINLKKPDEDLLHMGASETDDIIYNESLLSTIQISLLYKFDLSQFEGKTITDARLTAYCGLNSNLNPHLGAIRTELWEKGVTYSTAPKHLEGVSIKTDPTLLTSATHGQNGKNYLPHTIVMTDWAKDALAKAQPLAIKLLGIPQVKGNTSAQIRVKGVNTSQKAYLSVTVDEQFNFPVAQVEKETDIDRNTFTKLNFLTKLGVFKEGEEFPADLTTGVTRREFISYAIRLMNDFEYNEDAAQIFSDVAPKSAAYGAIMESAALGLISSGEGMEFRPDDVVTYDEALTVIGRMLGYGTYAERNGGFSVGYVSAALKSDLLKGVRNHGGKLGFDSMFNLFFNALESPMFEASVYYSTGNRDYTFDSNVTLLSEYWNLKEVEGTVEGNEYTNLNPDISGTSGQIVINGKKYNNSNPDYNFLLGYKVKGYYDREDNLLYLGAEENTNDSDVIDLHTVTNVTKGGAITFSYEDKNGKNKSESIKSTDKIIYNGKSIKFSQLTAKLLDKDTGSITYLNDDIVIINAYTTVVVYNIDEKEEIVSDKYSPFDNTLRLKDTDYYIFRDENGDSIALDKLAANDVISAAVSLDKKLVIGEVSKTKLTGKVTSIRDDNEIDINGQLYKTAGENLSWLDDIKKIGTQGTFLLDVFGFVAGFEAARPTENILGYVILSGTSGNGIKAKLQLGLITTEAEKMVAYNLAEKVVIDGVPCKTHDAILKALGDTDGTGTATDVKKQGIVFSVNQDREITKIDTSACFNDKKEIEETSLHLRYDKADTLRYKSGAGRLGDLFYWDRATALNVMFTGDDKKAEELNDPEYYQYFRSGITNDTQYNVEVYSVGKKHPKADIVLVKTKPSNEVSGTIAIAGKRVFALNADGNYDEKLYYYVASTTASSAIISSDFDTKASSASKSDLAALKPGDIIRVGKDFNGNLMAIKRYYAYDKENPQILSNPHYAHKDSSGVYNFHKDNRIFGGYVTTKYDSYVRFIDDISKIDTENEYKEATDDMFRWIDLNMNSGTNKKVFKYEVEGNEVVVSKATADDVVDYDHVPYSPSGIMLQTTYGQQIDAAYVINVTKPANTGIYKITFEPGENASGTKAFIRADLNDTVTLPSSEGFLSNNPAYAFDCWTYNGQDYIEGAPITVTGDMTLTAKWKWVGVQYDITYDGNGADSGVVTPARAIGGSTYTIAQNPEDTGFKKENYYFAGWEYKGVTYQPGDTITMPEEAITFKAVWAQPAGAGTQADPYRITNAKELKWFANYVNAENTTACAKLMNSIDLNSENWYDYRIKNFAGTFDGNKKTISNLKVEGGQYAALFQSVKGGSVKDLNITNAEIVSTYTSNETTASYTAVVCGYMENGTISNVSTSGTIKTASGAYANGTGSIVGRTIAKGAITIERCLSDVTIDLSNGGANKNSYSKENSINYGVGGIVGVIGHNSGNADLITIKECGFEGSINAPGTRRVAGIVGNIKDANNVTTWIVTKCYNTGSITALGQVAGIAGWVSNGTFQKNEKLTYCYNTGNIVAKTATSSYASGISNGAYGNAIKYCYSVGDVSVEETGKPTFNNTCALLYTSLYANTSATYYKAENSAYCDKYTYTNSESIAVAKHSVATSKTTYTTDGATAYNEAKFKDGTALTTLGTTNYAADTNNINGGYPVLKWQTE